MMDPLEAPLHLILQFPCKKGRLFIIPILKQSKLRVRERSRDCTLVALESNVA